MQKKNAFVAILMAVVVMLNVLICPVFAEYNKRYLTKEVVNFNNSIVHMLCDNLGLEVDLSRAKPLNDSNKEPRYMYIPFSEGGYLIYDSQENFVTEFSESEENEIAFDGADYIYAGPRSLYKIIEGGLFNIQTKEFVNAQEEFMHGIKELENDISVAVRENEAKIGIEMLSTNATSTISGPLPNYHHNPDGRCGATAAAMLLRWYDIYRNGKYVPSNLESSSGVALIDHLWSKMKSSTHSGAYTGVVYVEMMNYINTQGISHAGGIDVYSNEYVIGRVDSYGTPFLLNVLNHPKYENHFVTGYGYYSDSTGFYPIVNDGWGNRNIKIHSNYAHQIIW